MSASVMKLLERVEGDERVSVSLPLADYLVLLEHAGVSADIVWCHQCAAWLAIDDPYRATVEDFEGCWRSVTDRGHEKECRSYRAEIIEAAKLELKDTPHV